ncbi:MAG TPA: hypothetical protein ENH49_03725 [Candidatus Marinimicrobia bacterium]|nr:hypothetical protein [Candidatus Neomarinimicrobiota bacterium]
MKKILLSVSGFVITFILHILLDVWNRMQIYSQWVQLEPLNPFLEYWNNQNYFLGLSYGLAVGFTVYAVMRFKENSIAAGGMVGGLTLTGILYFGGCFLVACCGSPMLAVYLGLFGSKILGFTKPLILVITLISVVIGYFWVNRKSDSCRGREPVNK